jgi:3-deoxy-D-arabino-heptulosonate 7-phosphate (DAHP) synthase class II
MAKKKGNGTERLSWFDEKTHAPLIEKYTRQLDSFIETMADGIVEPSELKAQEKRLVKLMKEVEPQLDDDLHATVTQLLCELTAYDLMQTVAAIQAGRPKTVFRG